MVALLKSVDEKVLDQDPFSRINDRTSLHQSRPALPRSVDLVEKTQHDQAKKRTNARGSSSDTIGTNSHTTDSGYREQTAHAENSKTEKSAPSTRIESTPSEDPRLIEARREQERLKSEIENARRLAGGTAHNIANEQTQLDKMGMIDWAAGTSGTLKGQIEADKKLLEAQLKQIAKLEESARKQEQLAAEIKKNSEDAKRLAAEGKQGESQAAAQKADAAASAAHDISGQKMLVVTDEWRAAQQKAQAGYDAAISRINTTETVVQYVDTGVKTVAVVAGTVIAGPAGGAAASMVYDSAKNLGEQGSAVVNGDKTVGAALGDFALKEFDAAVDAGITLATGGAGKLAGGVIGGTLKGAAKVVVKAGVGAVSGAAVNTAAEGTKAGYEYAKARVEFERQNPNLHGEERDKAWAAYREAHGISDKDIGHRLGGAAISGGITGAAGSAAPGAGKVVQGGIGTGSNVVAAAAQEAATTGSVTPEGLIAAGVVGVIAHKAGRSTPTSGRRPSPSQGHTDGPHNKRPAVVEPVKPSAPETKTPHLSGEPKPVAPEAHAKPVTSAPQPEAANTAPGKPTTVEPNETPIGPSPEAKHESSAEPKPGHTNQHELPKSQVKPPPLMEAQPDGSLAPKMTPQQVLTEIPPPIPVPDIAKMKGPKVSATCHIVEYEWKAKISADETPNLLDARTAIGKTAPEAKVTLYYHEYKAGDFEPNYRINVRIGDTEFKGIPPAGWNPESGEPLRIGDLRLVRNEDWTNAINAKKNGTATPEQLEMVKGGHLEPGKFPTHEKKQSPAPPQASNERSNTTTN